MDVEDFWGFLESSAEHSGSPGQRLEWLGHRLRRMSAEHVADFHVHLREARRPIDTYAMWGAANQIMDGHCSGDGFWYFQPWLIGQGRRWYRHVAENPDNLADLPALRPLAGRSPDDWADAEWPWWEELAYLAPGIHDELTGEDDSLDDVIEARGLSPYPDPDPFDEPWDSDSRAEIDRRLPRLAALFPRRRYVGP